MELPLLAESPKNWAEYVVENFEGFLCDHAACERKAAALAMSMIAKYPDRTALIDPMVSLAREELEHFQEVAKLMQKKGYKLATADEKDPYVNAILKKLRHGRDERFLDRLVMSGIVEARGYERFHLLAQHLEDAELKDFYESLALREKGHYMIFIRLARLYFSEAEVNEAIERIAHIEADAMLSSPIRAALH